jgi:lambda repressor-like predicted transcriptional regulator
MKTNARKLIEVRKKRKGLERKVEDLKKEEKKLEIAAINDRQAKVTRLRRERGLSLDDLVQRTSMSREILLQTLNDTTPPNKAIRELIARSLGVPHTELWAL